MKIDINKVIILLLHLQTVFWVIFGFVYLFNPPLGIVAVEHIIMTVLMFANAALFFVFSKAFLKRRLFVSFLLLAFLLGNSAYAFSSEIARAEVFSLVINVEIIVFLLSLRFLKK